MTEYDAYNELCCYTLTHTDRAFIHQHVVDAYAAQSAQATDKPIKLTIALVGLYLHLEHQFTGRQVQLAHMKMARKKHDWPAFELPELRGDITAINVLAFPPGPQRDGAIDDWCLSVWTAYAHHRSTLHELLDSFEVI